MIHLIEVVMQLSSAFSIDRPGLEDLCLFGLPVSNQGTRNDEVNLTGAVGAQTPVGLQDQMDGAPCVNRVKWNVANRSCRGF